MSIPVSEAASKVRACPERATPQVCYICAAMRVLKRGANQQIASPSSKAFTVLAFLKSSQMAAQVMGRLHHNGLHGRPNLQSHGLLYDFQTSYRR